MNSNNKRFWTEIYQGAKLFYLSGMINGKYPKTEILNLSRFMAVMKYRPLVWRNTHSYLMADRVEDISSPETIRLNPKADRKVTLYGYLHGTNLKSSSKIHIAGVGDMSMSSIELMADPCPVPDKERKLLNEKHKMVYAPMSDVGGIIHDKDAIYITVPGNYSKEHRGEDEEDGIGEQMMMGLQDAKQTLSEQVNESSMRMFNESAPIKASDLRDYDSEDSEDEDNAELEGEEEDEVDGDSELESDNELDLENSRGRVRRKVRKPLTAAANGSDDGNKVDFADSDSDIGDLGEDNEGSETVFGGEEEQPIGIAANGMIQWKSKLLDQAEEKFKAKQSLNLNDLVYKSEFMPQLDEDNSDDDDNENEQGGGLFIVKKIARKVKSLALVDTCKFEFSQADINQWDDEEVYIL